MASWRQKLAQREARERWREQGMVIVYWFVGCVIGGALVVLGIWATIADAIPIASRYGTLWVSDHRKTGFALFSVSLGAALHFGLVWQRLRLLRVASLPGLVISLGGAHRVWSRIGSRDRESRSARPARRDEEPTSFGRRQGATTLGGMELPSNPEAILDQTLSGGLLLVAG